jgi:hypothetical protein
MQFKVPPTHHAQMLVNLMMKFEQNITMFV